MELASFQCSALRLVVPKCWLSTNQKLFIMPWTLSGIIIGKHHEKQVLTNLLFCRENNLGDQIQLIKGRLEDLDNIPKVDAIISEWMGYLLLFEGMLDSVIYARDHHLKPGGLLLPNRCDMSLVGISDMGE